MFLLLSSLLTAQAVPMEYLLSRKKLGNASTILGQSKRSTASFSSAVPIQSEIVLPFVGWGLRFDEDLMISLCDDDEWGMIEVAKVNLPSGEGVWFTLDSKIDGRQYVGLPSSLAANTMAKSFPAPSYDSNLVVVEGETTKGVRTIDVQYRRLDDQEIRFSMQAWAKDKAPSRRNGHAMNHSQGSVLAVLDIFSLRLQKPVWEGKEQRVLGVPVAGHMRQTVTGLRQGQWRQQGLTWSGITALSPSFQLQRSTVDNQIVLSTASQFPVVQYRFDKHDAYIELRSIEVHQNGPEPIAKIAFNPSLPDLRYGPPTKEVCSSMVVSLQKNQAYQQGEICFTPVDGNTTRVQVLSNQPVWAKHRPVIGWVTNHQDGIVLRSSILAMNGTETSHSYHALGEPEESIWTWKQLRYVWDKRPHRLSWFSLLIDETNPRRRLGGGTWANGKFASDSANLEVDMVHLKGAEFFSVTTPELPLTQRSDAENSVSASHWLHLKFARKGQDVLPWIQGFHLAPGPLHHTTGITTAGFSFSVDEVVPNNEGASIKVSVSHRFGSVPDRNQKKEVYSALAKLQIGFALLPSSSQVKTATVEGNTSRKWSLYPKKKVIPDDPSATKLVQQYEWKVTNKQKHLGRYLRGIGMSATPNTASDVFDNAGPITRKTDVYHRKVLVWSDELTIMQTRKSY